MLIYTIFYSCFIVHKIDSFCFTSSCSNEIDVNFENLNMENVTASKVFKGDGLSLTISQHTNDPSLYTDIKITSALLQMLTSLGLFNQLLLIYQAQYFQKPYLVELNGHFRKFIILETLQGNHKIGSGLLILL